MPQKNTKLTSVELDPILLQEFKAQCARDKFTLHKLLTRSIYLYLTDPVFRKQIRNQIHTTLDLQK